MDQAVTSHEYGPGVAVRAFLAKPHRMLIDGEWLEAQSGEVISVVNPANGELIGTVPACGKADIDEAVRAARTALENPAWSKMRPADRERMLLRLADLIEAHADELADWRCWITA
jgi:phenylacetaldehyde dehydrogenase